MSAQNNTPRPRQTGSGQRIGRIGQWGDSSGNSNSGSRSSSGARIATFRDLQSSGGGGGIPTRGDDDDNDSEDDGRQGQTWFTGGERSGLSVQNPNRRGDESDAPGSELVKNLLKKAAEGSGTAPSSSTPPSRSVFGGAGHTLGSDEVESQLIPDPNAPSEQPPMEERVVRHITFWRNGFSVEDGPLFRYDDPANSEILRSIDQGTAPADIMNVHYGQSVELRVTRRTGEDYIPPPPKPVQPFGGSGHRLGAPTPPIAGAGGQPAPSVPIASTSASVSTPAAPEREPERLQMKYEAGQSEENTTTIRIRLADGTVIPCRMNLTHTIGDILNFINAARPDNLTRSYSIYAAIRPNVALKDKTQTIEAAGLQRSVVIQRWD